MKDNSATIWTGGKSATSRKIKKKRKHVQENQEEEEAQGGVLDGSQEALWTGTRNFLHEAPEYLLKEFFSGEHRLGHCRNARVCVDDTRARVCVPKTRCVCRW